MTCKRLIKFFISIFFISVFFIACDKQYLQDHIKDVEPDTYGLWEVGHEMSTFIDKSRDNRTIKVDIWYPVDFSETGKGLLSSYKLKGPLDLTADIAIKDKPVSNYEIRKLIVFSHGYGGTKTQSTPLMETLASHGFIVVSPEHTGNSQHSPGDSFDQAAMNRVPDISFIIDTMFSKNNNSSDLFYDCIDESGVGVVGHSFGGMTSLGSAAGWAGAEADVRVKAIVPISAILKAELTGKMRPNEYAKFQKESISSISVPVMLIGGTKDVDVLIENNKVAFDWLIKPPVYRVDIIGATHSHFVDVCTFGELLFKYKIGKKLWGVVGAGDLLEPYEATCSEDAFPIAQAERLQNLYVVSFLKRYLYEDKYYEKFLTDVYAEQNEPDVVFYSK